MFNKHYSANRPQSVQHGSDVWIPNMWSSKRNTFICCCLCKRPQKNRSQWLTLNRTTCLATQWEKLLPTPATCQGQTKSRQHRPKQQQTFLAQLTRANNTSTTGLHPSAIANCWLNFIKTSKFSSQFDQGWEGGGRGG